MDFDLSTDQRALKEAAAGLLARYASRERVRRRVGEGTLVGTLPGAGAQAGGVPAPENGDLLKGSTAGSARPAVANSSAASGYDGELWSAMAEQGWLAVERPESEGGLGLGMVEVAVLCEELARHVAPAPFVSTILALDALGHDSGTERSDRVAEWVDALTSGRAVACVAWSPRPGWLRVERQDGSAHLTGHLDAVQYAPSADIAVVAGDGGVFALDLTRSRRAAAEPAMDRTRELGRFELDGVLAHSLGGEDAQRRLEDRAATATSAELLGTASRALEMAVDYAKDRVQFGKPIGGFQAVKHRLADSLVDVEGMRSTVYYAAWCNASESDEASLASSMAKSWCSEAGRRVLAAALQVHGGIAFTWEHDLHLYLKRCQLDQVSFGDAAWHRDRIASILRGRLARGEGIV